MALSNTIIRQLEDLKKYPHKIRFKMFQKLMSTIDVYNLDGDTVISAYKLCGLDYYNFKELV